MWRTVGDASGDLTGDAPCELSLFFERCVVLPYKHPPFIAYQGGLFVPAMCFRQILLRTCPHSRVYPQCVRLSTGSAQRASPLPVRTRGVCLRVRYPGLLPGVLLCMGRLWGCFLEMNQV